MKSCSDAALRAATGSIRPGTPGAAATPAMAVSIGRPASTRPTMAAMALETLKGPGRATEASASIPPGPTTRKELPVSPRRTSTAFQSASMPFSGPASDPPSTAKVVTGMSPRPATMSTRARPKRSSVLTTAMSQYSGVNRRALVSK